MPKNRPSHSQLMYIRGSCNGPMPPLQPIPSAQKFSLDPELSFHQSQMLSNADLLLRHRKHKFWGKADFSVLFQSINKWYDLAHFITANPIPNYNKISHDTIRYDTGHANSW